MWDGGAVSDQRVERLEALAAEVVEPVRRYLARRTDHDTAQDVLSEVLLVCWRRLDEVPEPALPWAYGVARGALNNAQRSTRRQGRLAARIAIVDPPPATAADIGAGPDDGRGPDAQERVRWLHEALSSLGATDAELLRLWAWEELGPGEIAVVLDITPNAASIRLYRARGRLRDQLRKIERGPGHEGTTGGRDGRRGER